MRKQVVCICENKDADQLRCNREADQRLCFRHKDSWSRGQMEICGLFWEFVATPGREIWLLS